MLNTETVTQPRTLGNLLAHCRDREIAIDEVTIKSSGSERTIALGTVLAVYTATGDAGLYIEPTVGGSNGIAIGRAVLAQEVTVPAAGNASALVVARHAIVKRSELTFPAGASAAEKSALEANLEPRALLVRD